MAKKSENKETVKAKPAAKKQPENPDVKPPEKQEEKGNTETLEDIESDLEKQSASNAKQKAKPKAKRGRPKKEKPPEIAIDSQMLEQAMATAFEILARRAGDHWRLSPEEIQNGSLVFDALFEKYFPLLSKYAVEVNCLVWTVMVLGPRYYMSVQIKKAQIAQKKAEMEATNASAPQ